MARALTQPLKIQDDAIPVLLDRYRNGELIADLAAELHCSPQALYARLRLYCDSGKGDVQYHDLVTEMYVLRNLENEQALDDAREPLELARAREKVKCSQWHLERRRQKLYGPKQEVQVDKSVTIYVNRSGVLPSPATQTIDVIPANITQESQAIESVDDSPATSDNV